MVGIPEVILKQTLKELGTNALKTQAEIGPGFWVIIGDTRARYYGIEDIANVYSQMSSKRQRTIGRMIKRADLARQAVISFHLPDGKLLIETYTIE